MGVTVICVEQVFEIGVEYTSGVELKLWLGEIELDRALILVCVPVTVSGFVSDTCYVLLTTVVSIGDFWLLSVEDPADEASPPPPIPSIGPSP